MDNKNFKVVEVQLEAEIYEEVQAYCALENLEEEELIKNEFKRVLKEKLHIIDTLRKGYAEMAGINLDICNEFEASEREAFSQY